MKTANTKTRTLYLTQTALFSALIIAMTFIPYVGYIVLGPTLSITTLHIPVIIGAILLGRSGGTILGAVWGITCLIYAAMNGTADAAIFLDPRISVIPRILVGFLTAVYYLAAMKLFKKLKPTAARGISVGIAAVLGTLTNTVLVLTAISLFGSEGFVALTGVIGGIFKTMVALNGVVELAAAVLIAIPACLAVMRERDKHRV